MEVNEYNLSEMRLFKRKNKNKQTSSSSGEMVANEASYDWESYDDRDEYAGNGPKQTIKTGKECNVRSRDGVPIVTSEGADHFSPSAVNGQNNYAVSGFYTKQKDHNGANRPKVRPKASTSAFAGAPRYDWMDIVSSLLFVIFSFPYVHYNIISCLMLTNV